MSVIRLFILLFAAQLFNVVDNGFKTVQADDITGKWITTDNEAIVEVYENKGLYYGRIISLSKPKDKKGHPKKDHRNRDPLLRERSLLGINTLYDLKFNAIEQNWRGKVYIPLTGMEVDGIITLKNDKKTMYIKGSLGSLRKTQVWVRNSD